MHRHPSGCPGCASARPRVRPLLFLLGLLACTPFGQAQPRSPAASADAVVVTASRIAEPLSGVLADLTVLDREAIERSGALALADLLARLPGIEMARNGGPGGVTSVFIRGNEARHTALYIDGVRVDSQATGGALWEQIPLLQIERIEVLRGPAAAVYGSDALAGVVQLFTRKGSTRARVTASISAGTLGTARVQAGLEGAGGGLDYALSGSAGRSDGFDARTTAVSANRDRDGWRQGALSARLGWQLDDRHRLEARTLASRLKARYDAFSPGFDDIGRHTLASTSLSWQGRWSPQSSTQLQIGQSDSTYETQPSFYRTETRLRNHVLVHEHRRQDQRLTLTLERREDRLVNAPTSFTALLAGDRHQDALGLGWHLDLGPHALQIHLRRDRDSEFGSQGTGSLAWGWHLAHQWRFTASAATAFRVPTLYQRFSTYGNPELVPERGRNVEVGLRWNGAGAEVRLVAWRNRVSDLIGFGAPGPCADAFGCFVNVGRARLEGVTLSGQTRWGPATLQGALNWHDPRNLDTGTVLQRRARRLASLSAEMPVGGWDIGAELQASGVRFENVANTQALGGYGLVNLHARTLLRPGLTLEGRIDNLGDKRHELARAFATAGRTAQVTLRWATP